MVFGIVVKEYLVLFLLIKMLIKELVVIVFVCGCCYY